MQLNTMFLTENQKVMWAKAGAIFPSEQLYKVVQRVLIDLPGDHPKNNFYEIRRFDAPHAFDAILKLQNEGVAHRHIEVEKDEYREVLRVEATLFDLIMQAIAMLLDVFLRLLGGVLTGVASSSSEPPVVTPLHKEYVPTWQRQARIGHDGTGYTP